MPETTVFRNGFQFTLLTRGSDIRRQPGINIHDVQNNTPNMCTFTIDGKSNAPIYGELIEILDSFDNDRLLFRGTILSYVQVYEGQTDQLAWHVTCADFTWLLNRRYPFGSYRNISASVIVADLINKYAPGFTGNHIQQNLAKVTIHFDGADDFGACLSKIAQMIGGGRWDVDYDQDVHFFHVVPASLAPPLQAQANLGPFMTISEGALLGGVGGGFDVGYYFLRYTYVYDDGTESAFGSISNMILMSGSRQMDVINVPVGTTVGTLIPVARRIYYNEFVRGVLRDSPIENIKPLIQINDNTTTGFTWYGGTRTSVGVPIPGPASTLTTVADPTSAPSLLERVDLGGGPGAGTYEIMYTYSTATNFTQTKETLKSPSAFITITGSHCIQITAPLATDPRVTQYNFYAKIAGVFTFVGAQAGGTHIFANVVGGSYTGVNSTVDQPIPVPLTTYAGHPSGPSQAPSATIDILGPSAPYVLWNGGSYQFKYANLYRDGSVSFPSPPSNTVTQLMVNGYGIKGFNLSGIAPGPNVSGNDVVARFVYVSGGLLNPSNLSLPGEHSVGFISPQSFDEPTWAETSTGGNIAILPDNITTSLSQFSLGDYHFKDYFPVGGDWPPYDGVRLGRGNKPYDNGAILSVDPIPIWPNPDGPSLEDVDPPSDLNDDNPFTLHEDAGSPFTVTSDLSQIRNKVIVIGSGSITAESTVVGAQSLSIADISTMSPSGGKVRVEDLASGRQWFYGYKGVSGVVGRTSIVLTSPITELIVQGAVVTNYFEANDYDSQKFLAKIELDKNGKPTDGVHEYVIIDNSLKAVFQLYMRAYAELELFSKPIVQISYSTREPTRTGQMVHVDQTYPPCQGDFLIQEVTIDQIHDESDQLMPRYTVKASSVRFELNDLLIQILQNSQGSSSGAGVSLSGLIQGATTQSASTGGNPQINPRYAYGFINTGPTLVGVGTTFANNGATLSHDDAEIAPWVSDVGAGSRHDWVTIATGAVADAPVGVRFSPSPGEYLEDNVDITMHIKTPVNLTSIILWAGLTPAGGITAGDTPVNASNCSVRYMNYAGVGKQDPGWMAVLQTSGVGHPSTKRFITTILPSTEYIIRIQSSVPNGYASASVTFTINGVSITIPFSDTIAVGSSPPYNMPVVGGSAMAVAIGVNSKVAAIRKISFRRFTSFTN